MCARFYVAGERVLKDLFGLEKENFIIQYNAAPTDPVSIAVPGDGRIEIETARFGLRPVWSKKPLINAKAENVLTQGAFREGFEQHRCLVPATGFYEWETTEDGKKLPYLFQLAGGKPFAFAGFWAEGQSDKEFCVLTTVPNPLLAKIHDRMPAIVRKEDFDAFLRGDARLAQKIALNPYPASEMTSFRVSTKMSSSKYKEPDCVAPIESA